MEDIYKLVGKKVREERKRMGLTQEDLAFKTKLSLNCNFPQI